MIYINVICSAYLNKSKKRDNTHDVETNYILKANKWPVTKIMLRHLVIFSKCVRACVSMYDVFLVNVNAKDLSLSLIVKCYN